VTFDFNDESLKTAGALNPMRNTRFMERFCGKEHYRDVRLFITPPTKC